MTLQSALPQSSSPVPAGTFKARESSLQVAVNPAALLPTASSASGRADGKVYSPFKTFKMPGSFVNWGAEKPEQVKGFASPSVSSGGGEDRSKAPGFRTSQAGLGSPENVPPSTTTTTTSKSAAGFKKTGAGPGAGSQSMAEPLFSIQERCNSAPGTPVSPLVPSPIAPPIQAALNKTANSSPGSDPDYYRGQILDSQADEGGSATQLPQQSSQQTVTSDTVVSDTSEHSLTAGLPSGLTGDIFKDTELVELKVLEICRKHKMTEQDKVELFSSIVLRR